jgi:hypothetical protein
VVNGGGRAAKAGQCGERDEANRRGPHVNERRERRRLAWKAQTKKENAFLWCAIGTRVTPPVLLQQIQYIYSDCYSINLIQGRCRFLLLKLELLKSIGMFEFSNSCALGTS